MPHQMLTRFADTVMLNENRLPLDELADLRAAHNVNLTCDDDSDDWFDEDLDKNVSHVTIIEEQEFWDRFGD